MPNTIDEIMAKDPLGLSAQDFDALIIYHRKARASFESGVKPSKKSSSISQLDAKIKLKALGLQPKAPTFKRRNT